MLISPRSIPSQQANNEQLTHSIGTSPLSEKRTYSWVFLNTHPWVIFGTHSWVTFHTYPWVSKATHEWVLFCVHIGWFTGGVYSFMLLDIAKRERNQPAKLPQVKVC